MLLKSKIIWTKIGQIMKLQNGIVFFLEHPVYYVI